MFAITLNVVIKSQQDCSSTYSGPMHRIQIFAGNKTRKLYIKPNPGYKSLKVQKKVNNDYSLVVSRLHKKWSHSLYEATFTYP